MNEKNAEPRQLYYKMIGYFNAQICKEKVNVKIKQLH
jgi:hypothetical protein